MKRIAGLLALVALLVAPSLAFAAETTGGSGLYIATKFVVGNTKMRVMGVEEHTGIMNPSFLKMADPNTTSFGGALAIGYDFYKKSRIPLRMEMEGSMFAETTGKENGVGWLSITAGGDEYIYDMNLDAKLKMQIETAFVNVYYDFRNDTPFSFWIGGGVGNAFVKAKGDIHMFLQDPEDPEDTYSSSMPVGAKNHSNFAWNAGLGVAYAISNALTVDFGYRFVDLGKVETKISSGRLFVLEDSIKAKDVHMHQFLLGLRFSF